MFVKYVRLFFNFWITILRYNFLIILAAKDSPKLKPRKVTIHSWERVESKRKHLIPRKMYAAVKFRA